MVCVCISLFSAVSQSPIDQITFGLVVQSLSLPLVVFPIDKSLKQTSVFTHEGSVGNEKSASGSALVSDPYHLDLTQECYHQSAMEE